MMAARAKQLQPARMGGVPQREADLLPLRWAVQRAATPAIRAAAEAKLQVRTATTSGLQAIVQCTQMPAGCRCLCQTAGSRCADRQMLCMCTPSASM